MRISTLFTLAALACATTAGAQTPAATLRPARKAADTFSKLSQPARHLEAPVRASRAAGAIMVPLTEVFSYYEDGEWFEEARTTNTYNKSGHLLKTLREEDGSTIRESYERDAQGRWTLIITETKETGDEDFSPTERRERAYDPQIDDLVVKDLKYQWDGVESAWTLYSNCFERTVVRNAQGNITSVDINSLYQGAFEPIERTAYTYDRDGLANTYVHQQYDPWYDEWSTNDEFRNIRWQNTDGQLGREFSDYITGNNRFKSADQYENGELYARFTVTYKEGLPDYHLIRTKVDGSVREEHSYVTTDAIGSFKETIIYYEDKDKDGTFSDKEKYEEYQVVTYDERGNMIEQSQYGQEESGEPIVLFNSTRYTYTYDDATDLLTSVVIEDFVFDDDGVNGNYVPMMKTDYSDYVDAVTTGIEGVSAAAPADGPAVVFNLQGVAVGTSTDGLPAGLYIVRQGGKAAKVLKR